MFEDDLCSDGSKLLRNSSISIDSTVETESLDSAVAASLANSILLRYLHETYGVLIKPEHLSLLHRLRIAFPAIDSNLCHGLLRTGERKAATLPDDSVTYPCRWCASDATRSIEANDVAIAPISRRAVRAMLRSLVVEGRSVMVVALAIIYGDR